MMGMGAALVLGGSAIASSLIASQGGGGGGGTDPRFWENYDELRAKAEGILDAGRPIMINGFPVYPRGPERRAAAYMGLAPGAGGGGSSQPGLMDRTLGAFGSQLGGNLGKGFAGGIANSLFPQTSPVGSQGMPDMLTLPDGTFEMTSTMGPALG